MQIQINPRSLLNLTHICEVLYKLHPSVLDELVEMERSLGGILGLIDLNNVSLEEREFLSKNYKEKDYSNESFTFEDLKEKMENKGVKVTQKTFDNKKDFIDFINDFKVKHENTKILIDENYLKEDNTSKLLKTIEELKEDNTSKLLKTIEELEEDKNSMEFHDLRKYIQLDTDEYIPMKIYVEVEDPVIGRKVKELVEALEKTRAPEQFYLNKKELDENAYFAEGYGLTMNDEQKKQRDDFFYGEDVEGLESLLKREKLYP